VVINNFNAFRAISPLMPFEADAPLLIDPDVVLTFAVTSQCLQAIAANLAEIT
jgi:hypothetical protein